MSRPLDCIGWLNLDMSRSDAISRERKEHKRDLMIHIKGSIVYGNLIYNFTWNKSTEIKQYLLLIELIKIYFRITFADDTTGKWKFYAFFFFSPIAKSYLNMIV